MAWTTPRTWVASEVPTETTFNTHVRDNLNYLKGARTTYTPQVDQGASTNIAKTVNTATYTQVGDLVHVWVRVAMTAAGTAGSAVSITVPVTSAISGVPCGSGSIYDASGVGYWNSTLYLNSTTQLHFLTDQQAGAWGVLPNVALASGDVLYVCCVYPVV